MFSSYSFLFAASLGGLVLATNQQCFYPDGVTTDSNHVPCNSTIATSACCDPLDACTTSGLCLGRTGFNYRGSCTDKTWTDSNCPTSCHADPFDKVAYKSFTALWPCEKPGGFSGKFCCSSPGRNCCTIATFDYGTTGFAFKAGIDQMILELANVNSSSPLTVTVTATAGLASQTGSGNGSSSSSSSSSSDTGTKIGLAVGIPLGILALGILGFLFWRGKRRNMDRGGKVLEMDPSTSYYAPTQYQPPPQPQPQQYMDQTGNTAYIGPQEIGRRHSTQKSAGSGRVAGVHELI